MTILNLRYRILLAAFPLSLLLPALVSSDAQAEGTDPHHQTITSAQETPSASVASYTLQGVVVELQGELVVLNHQAVVALNWPAMTMPFKVADKALLAKVKVGAKVRFDLSGQTITAIRPQ